MKLCFYCVMHKFSRSELRLRSIDDQKLILIHSSDLYAAVSYTKYKVFENSPENIAIHERIIRTIQKHTPVIPFPLNTIVGETIGRGVLYANYAELKNVLKKIGRYEEYVLNVQRDKDKKLQKFYNLSRIKSTMHDPVKDNIKKPYNKILDVAAYKLAARIHNQFEQISVDSYYERLISESRLFEGYYLVSSRQVDIFKQTYQWVQSLYPELHFFLRGPQPAYHFNPARLVDSNTDLLGKKHYR